MDAVHTFEKKRGRETFPFHRVRNPSILHAGSLSLSLPPPPFFLAINNFRIQKSGDPRNLTSAKFPSIRDCYPQEYKKKERGGGEILGSYTIGVTMKNGRAKRAIFRETKREKEENIYLHLCSAGAIRGDRN